MFKFSPSKSPFCKSLNHSFMLLKNICVYICIYVIYVYIFICLLTTLFRFSFYFFKINLFIYFWLCWVFAAMHGLSLVVVSWGYSSLQCAGFSLQWLLFLWNMGCWRVGFCSCCTWAQQLWFARSRAQAQQSWHTGLVAPWHVGSSQTRARTHVPCIHRWILNHCTTRGVPIQIFFGSISIFFSCFFQASISSHILL